MISSQISQLRCLVHKPVADVDQLFALEELFKNTVEIFIVLYCDVARLGLFELISVVDLCKIVAHASVDGHDGRVRQIKFNGE